MKLRFIVGGIVLLASGLASVPAKPCCMIPTTYEGTISQSAQEAVLFHHGGREELILKINYRISGKALPDRFAWVITVPSEPDAYAVADERIFREVFAWADPLVVPPTRGLLGDAPDSEGLHFGKPVKVGPFEIQPVRALGRGALAGLNRWLQENGFPAEEPKHMQYFVANQFTFLCVKFNAATGAQSVAPEGGVPPLHLSFASRNPYYPLRFSSRQGVFDVHLYVFTKNEFDYESSRGSLDRMSWSETHLLRNVPVVPASFPVTLREVYAKTRFKDDAGEWRLNILRTRETNKHNSISKWNEDVFFRTKG